MRNRSSIATAVTAAVAAVVFSAAFQPAEAGTILISDGYQVASGTTVTFGQNAFGGESVSTPGAPFDSRATGWNTTGGSPSFTVSGTSTIGSGSATVSFSQTAVSCTNPNGVTMNLNFYNADTSPSNLIGNGLPQNDTFVVDVLGFAATGAPASFGVELYDVNGNRNFYNLPTNVALNNIPFTGFTYEPADSENPGSFDWASVTGINLFVVSTSTNARSASMTIGTVATVAAVPEPSQMVFVAGMGATLGVWRLRKLRRVRGASKAAAV